MKIYEFGIVGIKLAKDLEAVCWASSIVLVVLVQVGKMIVHAVSTVSTPSVRRSIEDPTQLSRCLYTYYRPFAISTPFIPSSGKSDYCMSNFLASSPELYMQGFIAGGRRGATPPNSTTVQIAPFLQLSLPVIMYRKT
jgi:hypothetical protein